MEVLEADAVLDALPPLGVGILFNPALPGYLAARPETFDYVEVIPEMFWSDHGRGASPRFAEVPANVALLDRIAGRCPVVAHHIGLSLGSADYFDDDYLAQVAAWQRRFGFAWRSDHLSFVRMSDAAGHDHNVGMAAPVPYDREVAEMIAERIRAIRATGPAPVLIENNVYFVTLDDEDLSEVEFLNLLSATSGCGLLLDLHNLYANARNHGFDPFAWLDRLRLDRVVEVHVAGGSELAGMYTDSHAGPCPPPVWDLLDHVVPRAPRLRGITFEFHDSYYPRLLEHGVADQLARARQAWTRRAAR